MCICSCVCKDWNQIISGFKELRHKRDRLDPCEKISIKKVSKFVKEYDEEDFAENAKYVCIGPRGNDILVSDTIHDRIVVFDLSGNFKFEFGSKRQSRARLNTPQGICVRGSELLVANTCDQRIQILSREYQPIAEVVFQDTSPTALCFSSKGKLLVIMDDNTIYAMDLGTDSTKDNKTLVDYSGTIKYLNDICCNSMGEIICSTTDDTIEIFSENGDLLRCIGSRGDGPDQFIVPSGVCVDENDNIFVADCGNRRISIFTPDGIPIQQITNIIKGPYGLCINGKRIIATVGEDHLCIFSN